MVLPNMQKMIKKVLIWSQLDQIVDILLLDQKMTWKN